MFSWDGLDESSPSMQKLARPGQLVAKGGLAALSKLTAVLQRKAALNNLSRATSPSGKKQPQLAIALGALAAVNAKLSGAASLSVSACGLAGGFAAQWHATRRLAGALYFFFFILWGAPQPWICVHRTHLFVRAHKFCEAGRL